jgi:hypothetical protein
VSDIQPTGAPEAPSHPRGITVSTMSPTDRIPEPLRRFLAEGGAVFRCDDGDWDVRIELETPGFLQRALPPNALIIANNGCGDYLFVMSRDEPDSKAESSRNPVFVYWHDEAAIREFKDDLCLLTNPPDPEPSKHPVVFYVDGATPVMLGDHVSARDLLFRKQGRVVYVPGVSRKNREFENGGLSWVGIRFDGGPVTGVIVDPESNKLKSGVRFHSRGTSTVREIGPHEALD